MSNYLLLKDNRQSGPYSLEQLITLDLQPKDLVWVQGQSEGWTYASEIKELSELLQPKESPSVTQNSNSVILNNDFFTSGKTKRYKMALVAAGVAILILSGFLINKFFYQPEEVQIKASGTPAPRTGEPVTNAENFQNALSKEFIPEVKPKKIKPKDLKKLVAVETNEYHVRLLGGINDLKLTVQNYSEHLLDKVIIKVDYLKPKGEVVNSEVVTIKNIKPQDLKIVEVPPSKRGVKVKYTIMNVYSQEYKTVLEEV